ncbi:MAG: hypothetical protein EOO39_13560 [Cytophagaceae bacterium]|nr:MAG: hypothetical protein EOO39_13560 [Cytophagaceae bacterium]
MDKNDPNRNQSMNGGQRNDMNSGGRNATNDRFSSDRQDLIEQLDEQIANIDKQMDGMKGDGSNENRSARKAREDAQKDLQDKRRQLTDQVYKVQHTSENDFRQVRRETNRMVDDVSDSLEKMMKKADKK